MKTTQIEHSNLHLFLHFQWTILNIEIYCNMHRMAMSHDVMALWPMSGDAYHIMKCLPIPSPIAYLTCISTAAILLSFSKIFWEKSKRFLQPKSFLCPDVAGWSRVSCFCREAELWIWESKSSFFMRNKTVKIMLFRIWYIQQRIWSENLLINTLS